jgi:D-proline reductase (dithiol) PrdB
MGDRQVREALSDLEGFAFDEVPWTTPAPLAQSRVAVVTTAGLRTTRPGESTGADWNPGDQSFTVLPADARDLTLAHFSPNFDRTGWIVDSNVVFPIDRLNEMAEEGVIGSVADVHISFMGAQIDHTLETIRLDTGPAAARHLLDDGVDVVLLTPV